MPDPLDIGRPGARRTHPQTLITTKVVFKGSGRYPSRWKRTER